MTLEDKAAWEQAEIERSTFEAAQTSDEQLVASPKQPHRVRAVLARQRFHSAG